MVCSWTLNWTLAIEVKWDLELWRANSLGKLSIRLHRASLNTCIGRETAA
jgi:hypothetical protein